MFTEIKDLFILIGIGVRFAFYMISHFARYKPSSSIYEVDGLKILIHPYFTHFFTIWEVFIDKTYKPSSDKFPRELETVIDLGAFFGDFSLWVTNNYAVGKVYAVEFQKDNFELLCQNIKTNKLEEKIIPINTAVYCETNVKVGAKKYTAKWTNILEIDPSADADEDSISSITLSDLLKTHNIEVVDFLKMDIEGSERYVLTPDNAQLFKDKVRYVGFEAHALNSVDPLIYVKYFEDLGYKVKFRRARQKIEFNTHLEVEAYNSNFKK